MDWQPHTKATSNAAGPAIITAPFPSRKQVNADDPDYVNTACTIYEALITNYLAIADELARREGIDLLFPPKNESTP